MDSSPLLAVCSTVPDRGSADPARRLTGRWLLSLTSLVPVQLVVAEPGRREPALDTLAGAGVDVLGGGIDWLTLAREAARNARAVVVSDLLLADRLGSALEADGVDVPLVLLVADVLSAGLSESPPPGGDDDLGGRALLVGRLRDRELAALERAAAVGCFSEACASAVGGLGGVVAEPLVLGDGPAGALGPAGSPREAARSGFDDRRGFVTVLSLSEGLLPPGEAGLRWVRDEVGPALAAVRPGARIGVVAGDAEPKLRRVGDHVDVVPARRWLEALGEFRVGLVMAFPGKTGETGEAADGRPAALEMAARGLPFAAPTAVLDALGLGVLAAVAGLGGAGDPSQAARVMAALHDDPERWHEARSVIDGWLANQAPASDPSQRLVELLARAGVSVEVGTEGGERAPAPSPVGAGRATGGGTLADVDLRDGTFEHEVVSRPMFTREAAHDVHAPHDPPVRYRIWRTLHLDEPELVVRPRALRARALRPRPTFSVILPVYGTDPRLLDQAVASVVAQTYGDWELCAVDDASPTREPVEVLEGWARRDGRVKVERLDENRGIAGASNAALAMATGDFVALLDHDDVLHPEALFWVARVLAERPDADVVYSDWERIDDDGVAELAFLKPDWSPELLLSVNYLIHLTALRRSLVEEVGGWRAGFDGAQDYDLFLRVTERTDRVAHVPRPLYGWRATAGSTAVDVGAKPEADAAGRRAVAEAVERRGLDADVLPGHMPTHFRVRYRHRSNPPVTIVIPTRDRVDLLRACVDGVRAATDYPRYELLVLDNQSRDPETLDYLERFDGRDGRVVRYPHTFNYARQANLGVHEAGSDLVLLLNNDVVPLHPEWLSAMVEHGQRDEVGAVGARLWFPDGRRQHEGITVDDLGGLAANLDGGEYFTFGQHVRECAAVTGACLLTRAGAYWAVGGFDERLRVAWNDVDFCLRLGEAGWKVIYTPYAELIHAESSSRADLNPLEDRHHYEDRWGPSGAIRDPFFHPSLAQLNPWLCRL